VSVPWEKHFGAGEAAQAQFRRITQELLVGAGTQIHEAYYDRVNIL
jgi:hypothetical protein